MNNDSHNNYDDDDDDNEDIDQHWEDWLDKGIYKRGNIRELLFISVLLCGSTFIHHSKVIYR